MPAVEFHILSEAGDHARVRYTCQLIDQAYEQGERSFVRAGSTTEAQRIDDALWTFRDQAFIPHELCNETTPSHPRVMSLIGLAAAPKLFSNLLINLSNELPADLEALTRVIEVVDADPQHKQQARLRYKQYRDRGCVIETKDIS